MYIDSTTFFFPFCVDFILICVFKVRGHTCSIIRLVCKTTFSVVLILCVLYIDKEFVGVFDVLGGCVYILSPGSRFSRSTYAFHNLKRLWTCLCVPEYAFYIS